MADTGELSICRLLSALALLNELDRFAARATTKRTNAGLDSSSCFKR